MPSPPHSPHSSTTEEPPQSPAQSSSNPEKHTPSQPTSGPAPPQSSLLVDSVYTLCEVASDNAISAARFAR